MNSIREYAKEQYGYVQGSRRVLFDYCEIIKAEDFVDENTPYNNGSSIRNLLVHIANTYEHWIAKVVLKKSITYSDRHAQKSISDVVKLFNSVDVLLEEFISGLENSEAEIEYQLNSVKGTVKLFKLFTHVITHEYHHKGQILSLSRQLGYVPVDTDVMR